MSTTIFPHTPLIPGRDAAEVVEPFDLFIDSGVTVESNTYIGSSQALGTLWEHVTVEEGDVVVGCPGGFFLVRDGQAFRAKMALRREHLFCKGAPTRQVWPLTHLEEVDYPGLPAVVRKAGSVTIAGARTRGAVIAENGTDWIHDRRG